MNHRRVSHHYPSNYIVKGKTGWVEKDWIRFLKKLDKETYSRFMKEYNELIKKDEEELSDTEVHFIKAIRQIYP